MGAPRRGRRPKLKHSERFVRFEYWELETEAFGQLSADGTRVYLFMRKRFNGSNNGQVVFSHRDAQKALNSDWRRAAKAIKDLLALGFIKWRNHGEQGLNIRLACEWQLTAFECGGQPASKDFARWEKQLPTCRMPTPRLQDADASPAAEPNSQSKRGKPSAGRRRSGVEGVGRMPAHIDLPPRGGQQSDGQQSRGDAIATQQAGAATRAGTVEPTPSRPPVNGTASASPPPTPPTPSSLGPGKNLARLGFANWLLTERTARGITNGEVAYVCKVGLREFADIELGRVRIAASLKKKIIDFITARPVLGAGAAAPAQPPRGNGP